VVLSPPEVDAFFRHIGTLRYRAALMTAYGAGLTVPFRGLSLRVPKW
jgi:hypothetical protein